METLEEMKKQIAILKSKIENEEIINEKMVRRAIKSDYSLIRRHVVAEIVCAAFVIVWALTYIPFVLHLDWAFAIGTVVFMLICMGYTVWMSRHVNISNVASLDLATAARQMKVLKREYNQWFYVGIPLLLIWISAFAYEVWMVTHEESMEFFWTMVIGMAFGLVVGGAIGLRMRRKIFDACDDVIAQTKE